jgi:hypothetical protein
MQREVWLDVLIRHQQAKTELEGINRKLKQLRTQVTALEDRKARLTADRVK